MGYPRCYTYSTCKSHGTNLVKLPLNERAVSMCGLCAVYFLTNSRLYNMNILGAVPKLAELAQKPLMGAVEGAVTGALTGVLGGPAGMAAGAASGAALGGAEGLIKTAPAIKEAFSF
jgi:hypothetical protein